MAKTSSAHSKAVSEQMSWPDTTLSRASDIAIARAVAEAVRTLPVVLDVSPGIVELAATYGPRERVTGVVVRRPNARDTIIEVHVILRGLPHGGSQQEQARGHASRCEAPVGTARDAVLTRSADEIRRAVYCAVQRLDSDPPAGVDVVIEDIQAPI
jgi:hypothetical protein